MVVQELTMAPVKKQKSDRSKTFLKEWREHRGMTLEEAAEKIDLHYTTLMRIERGAVPYNQDFLERAAIVYACDITDFLDNSPKAWNAPKLVYDALKDATPEKQRAALEIVSAFLKAG